MLYSGSPTLSPGGERYDMRGAIRAGDGANGAAAIRRAGALAKRPWRLLEESETGGLAIHPAAFLGMCYYRTMSQARPILFGSGGHGIRTHNPVRGT
jgi:hypothetical protein